ncbi:MAG: carboxypeptidase regulatory-like domain-containing protein [Acidobacteriia bacterium]|nr:carboxypeptidase regulatory-like domain-containing protein [Terriglobia bacterium]
MSRFAFTLRALTFALALLGLLTLGTGLAYGQTVSGNIVGTVTDSSGAAVVNADVTATNVATGVSAVGKTNSTGEYRFDNLLVGTYRIAVKSSGFRTTTVTAEILLNQTGTANVTLSPGASTETVEVSGEAPLLDTTTAQLQTTYQEKQLLDLPTTGLGVSSNGQNLGVINLSLLDAGVGSTGGLGAGTGPSVGGQRPRNNNFTVEGVDNNDKGVTGPLIYVPQDAVANFSVLQNQFNSEFGHSTGGQFSITVQSGTNSFHGRAYEYFQNRNLNAVDQSLANQGVFTNPRYDSNRFGGQVGGPIFKNKLFFFVNYEYNPVGQSASPGSPLYAPTAAGYNQLLAISGVSAANVNALKQFVVAPSSCAGQKGCPTPTVSGTPIEVGNFQVVAPNFVNYRALTTSMDYNLSDRDQIRGRYLYNKNASIDFGTPGVTLPIFYTPLTVPYHLISLSEYHTFSASVTNEVRVGYNRTGFNFIVPDLTFLPTLDAFPNITIDQLGGINIGPDPNAPQSSIQNLYQAVDNVTWVKGNHTLKFGVEGRKAISPQVFIQRSRGDYEYATLSAFALDQVPDGGTNERSFGSVGYSGDNYGIFWYGNDTWKVRPNLSINLGLRYEYVSTPFGWTQQKLNSVADVPGLITFGSPKAPTADFMPRVGFAFSPGSRGNTSIRGGFGMGYDVLYDNIGTLSRPPQIGATDDCPKNCADPFLANGGIPPQPGVSGITVLDPATARLSTSAFLPNNVKYPKALSWNLGVQHTFRSNYTAEVRYVGTRGEDLNVQNRLNIIPIVTPNHFLPTYVNAPDASCATTGCAALDSKTLTLDSLFTEEVNLGFMDPRYINAGFGVDINNFAEIVGFMPFGSSTYHGLQSQLNRRFSNGLQFQVAYTFSHNIDNSTADVFSTVIAPRRPQDFRNLPAERGNSVLDHRHRFTLSAVYDMPFNKNSSSWWRRNLLGNYEIAPVYTWESGQWGTVQSGVDSNLNTDGAGDRAIINSGGASGIGSDVLQLCNSSLPAGHLCNGDPDDTFDPSPFVVGYAAVNPGAKYIVAGPGALANVGRSTITTPPINNWDITLVKHIAVTERMHIELMAGFLNAFNHPQYTTGSVNQANSISVTGTGQKNFLVPSAGNFQNARLSFPSNARQTQLGLKFTF